MENKRKYFQQKEEMKYPDPGLSAESGWDILKNMLDKELPASGKTQGNRYYFLILIPLFLVFLLVISYSVNREELLTQKNTHSILNESLLMDRVKDEDENQKQTKILIDENDHSRSSPLKEPLTATDEVPNGEIKETNNKFSLPGNQNGKGRSEIQGNVSITENRVGVNNNDIHDSGSHAKISKEMSRSTANAQFDLSEPTGMAPLKLLKGRDSLIPDPIFVKNTYRITPENLITRSNRVNKFVIQGGISWEVNSYLNNLQNSFKYVNNNSGLIKALIPGIWISRKLSPKNELFFMFDPVSDYLTNDKLYSTKQIISDSLINSPDSLFNISSLFVHKIRSSKITVQSNWHLSNNWVVGTGIEYSKLYRALIETQIKSSILNDINYTDFSPVHTNLLRPGMWAGKAEVSYRHKSVSIGTAIQIPLHSLGLHTSIRPINGQFFVRWKFFN